MSWPTRPAKRFASAARWKQRPAASSRRRSNTPSRHCRAAGRRDPATQVWSEQTDGNLGHRVAQLALRPGDDGRDGELEPLDLDLADPEGAALVDVEPAVEIALDLGVGGDDQLLAVEIDAHLAG